MLSFFVYGLILKLTMVYLLVRLL